MNLRNNEKWFINKADAVVAVSQVVYLCNYIKTCKDCSLFFNDRIGICSIRSMAGPNANRFTCIKDAINRKKHESKNK